MRRFFLSLAVTLSALALAVPLSADDDDGYKKYRKRLKEEQKRQHEFFREQKNAKPSSTKNKLSETGNIAKRGIRHLPTDII